MENIEFKQSENQIKEQADKPSDIKEEKLNQNRSLQKHANLWMIHYLQITGASWVIGLNMSQEVYEMLEHGNNTKQSQYYVDLALLNHFKLDDDKQSLKYLQQALKWDSQNYEALALKGNFIRYVGMIEKNQKEYFDISQKSLTKSLDINPQCRLAQLYQARLQFQNDRNQSKQLFESILNKGKLSYEESYPEILAYARGLTILGKHKEALDVYDKAIVIHPEVTYIYRTMADCYYYLKEYQEAIKYYNKYLETHEGKRKQLFKDIGYCYYRLEKYDLALEKWKKHKEMCPDNKMNILNRNMERAEESLRAQEIQEEYGNELNQFQF